MGASTKSTWAADAAGTLLLFEPERLTLVTDQSHPLYDDRVNLPVDEALVRSIMARGVMQPVVAVRDAATGIVMVAAGRQRVKASIEANRRLIERGEKPLRIPVMPRTDTLAGAMVISASENAIRRDETPLQRASKMRAMLARGHDMSGVAEAFGCTEATVERTVALLDAHPAVLEAVADGAMTATAAQQIAAMPADKQEAAARRVAASTSGKAGHERAKAQRAALAAETGAPPRMRGAREIRDAMSTATPAVAAVLAWVLGHQQSLPAEAE